METQESNYDLKYLGGDPTQPGFNSSKAEYIKNKYSFTAEEMTKLQSLDTIAQMGQMAQMLIDSFVQKDPLARLNIKNSPDTGILYDIPKREFIVYNPKIWCSVCQNHKGTHILNNVIYCDTCLKTVQPQETPPEVQEEKPKETKKKK